MLFIGYFEGLDSQRGIAWRCADSLGLRAFLGFRLTILPESLLWDIIWLVLITVVMGGAFAIVNRSRKTGLF